MILAGLLSSLFVLPAAAENPPETRATDLNDPVLVAAKSRLADDPSMVDALAERLLRSRLGGILSREADPDARRAAIRAWIAADPESAARISMGLAQDEKEGATRFEDSLFRQTQTLIEDNPNAENNVFGRLRKAAKDSRLIKKQAEELSEDERREILRSLFEGKGSQSGKVIMRREDGKASSDTSDVSAAAFSGYYDRLSEGNLHGYSAQLLSLQSALNARRPPGAPALIETGKLDYATLSYPGHAMRYDLKNLELRLSRERLSLPARMAGRALSARELQDSELETKLRTAASSASLPARLTRRAALLEKARAAAAAFDAAAAKSRDPAAITKTLLIELGRDQKEASRWIAAAALEEELSRLETEENFLTPELLAAIDEVPAPAPMREAYKKRGTAFRNKYAAAKSNAQKAQSLLESEGWASTLTEADRLVAANRSLRRNLLRDTIVFSRVPWRIAGSRARQTRWREILDNLAMKWAPGTAFARAAALRRERLSRYLGVFSQVASGDLDAAAQSFSCAEPVRR